jgi:RNA polymerase sigma-70 factor (ECF subfamily)
VPILLSSPADNPPITELSLNALVERSRSGDVEAFNTLIDHFYRATLLLADRMLRDREAAQDATQEIFIKAWRHLPQFKGAALFSTWLHAIAVNHCITAARSLSRQSDKVRSLDREEGKAFSAPPSLPDATNWELHWAVRDAIGRLPEKLRLVLMLYYYAGYSIREIAAGLNLPRSTVHSRLDSALTRLGKTLERRNP